MTLTSGFLVRAGVDNRVDLTDTRIQTRHQFCRGHAVTADGSGEKVRRGKRQGEEAEKEGGRKKEEEEERGRRGGAVGPEISGGRGVRKSVSSPRDAPKHTRIHRCLRVRVFAGQLLFRHLDEHVHCGLVRPYKAEDRGSSP
jgi:hypothetical protein